MMMRVILMTRAVFVKRAVLVMRAELSKMQLMLLQHTNINILNFRLRLH